MIIQQLNSGMVHVGPLSRRWSLPSNVRAIKISYIRLLTFSCYYLDGRKYLVVG